MRPRRKWGLNIKKMNFKVTGRVYSRVVLDGRSGSGGDGL